MNAYINAGVYINWAFSRYFDLIVGGDFTHFSNGNTKFPNAGINTAGAKIGLVYNFNRTEEDLSKSLYQPVTTRFPAISVMMSCCSGHGVERECG